MEGKGEGGRTDRHTEVWDTSNMESRLKCRTSGDHIRNYKTVDQLGIVLLLLLRVVGLQMHVSNPMVSTVTWVFTNR